MLLVKDLRDSFLNFFKERDHRIISSSSLLPREDPTLLFTTAGMVQFKPMFAGTVKLDYSRAATVQKCLRTSDLENVGKTKRHCTFFEMLGNFSFGDYFKKEAIEYAWDYSANTIGFDKEAIWISIFEEDDEAFDIWKNHIGIPEQKIVRLGKADNFWGPAGDSGACGPCSELYIDRGPEFGCGSHDCKPGCDCERFLEYWNLVFNQFYQDLHQQQTPLPKTGIDTGMGLERLAVLVQNVESIYLIDEMKSLVDFVCKDADIKYSGNSITPVNVIVEHSRALTFAISDGAYPSNEGRGYVIRRILRRALRFGRQLGITEPFIYRIVEPIVSIMGNYYPEIKAAKKNVMGILEGEEKRFLETLENGMDRLEEILKDLKNKKKFKISGKNAFILYDTFGFPLEMTVEIASEQNFEVDIAGFNREMDKQRERGKKSWKVEGASLDKIFEKTSSDAGETVFSGYEESRTSSEITLLSDGKKLLDNLTSGDKGLIVTADTAFYGESGGQVGDTGKIFSKDGSVFLVDDTKRNNKSIIHIGEVTQGNFKKGDTVTTEINIIKRNLIRANHTSTHLLNAALRKVLGDHVYQSGSLVEAERFRFDFSHYEAISDNDIEEIEEIVNNKIWEAIPVKTESRNLDEALKMGATAVFDEKYDEKVRVVSIGDFSMELCGGTHVKNTGSIGVFKILREASPGAGMRRIEAVTLKGFLDRYRYLSSITSYISKELNVPEADIQKKIEDLLKRSNELEREIDKIKSKSLVSNADSIISNAIEVNGTKVIFSEFKDVDAKKLRELSDSIRSKEQNSIVIFGSRTGEKALLMFAATKRAVENGIDCGKIIGKVSGIVGGSGGGRKDMAQAGGKSPALLPKAIEEAVKIAQKMIGD